MRLILAGVAVALFIVTAVVLWSPAPRTGPEPIEWGRETCARCRMILSEAGFAGEIRDRRGQLSKYDDLGCLVLAIRTEHHEIPEAWVEDHDTHELVPLLAATLVRGKDLATPMHHGIVAFAAGERAEEFVRSSGGEVVSLEKLLRDKELRE